jgi:hypothetical protein
VYEKRVFLPFLKGKRNTKAWRRFKKSQYGKKALKNNGALSDLPKSFFFTEKNFKVEIKLRKSVKKCR